MYSETLLAILLTLLGHFHSAYVIDQDMNKDKKTICWFVKFQSEHFAPWQFLQTSVIFISDILEANGLMNIILIPLGWPVLYSGSFSATDSDPYMYITDTK